MRFSSSNTSANGRELNWIPFSHINHFFSIIWSDTHLKWTLIIFSFKRSTCVSRNAINAKTRQAVILPQPKEHAKYVDFIHMAFFADNFIIITTTTCEHSNCYFIATVTSHRQCLPFFHQPNSEEFQCQISLERQRGREKESSSCCLSASVGLLSMTLQSNETQKKIFSVSGIILNGNLAMTKTRGISWRGNVLTRFLIKSFPGLQRLFALSIYQSPLEPSSLIDL